MNYKKDNFVEYTASILICQSWVASEEDLNAKIWTILICFSINILCGKYIYRVTINYG